MENDFGQTVVFCFDTGERLRFDVSHLLLLGAECGGQALEAGPPTLCQGEHLLLHPNRMREAQVPLSTGKGAAFSQLCGATSPFPAPVLPALLGGWLPP